MLIISKLKKEIELFGLKRFLIALLLLTVLITVFVLKENKILYSEQDIMIFLKNYPVLAPFLFIAGYFLMIVFLIPTLPMNLGAGLLWGGFFGGVMSLLSTSLGAIAAFFISRYIAHDYFNAKFKSPMWQWLKERIQKNDWKIIAFTRINPIFPFAITSYFFGLTPVSFLRFFLSTAIPVILPAFLFSYVGHSIGGIILGGRENQILNDVLLVSALITAVVLIYFFGKKYFSMKKYGFIQDNGSSDKDKK